MSGRLTAAPMIVVDALGRSVLEARAFAALVRAGMIGLESPRRLVAEVRALNDYGAFGSAIRIAALKYGPHAAIADDRGEITFGELEDHVNRLANALRARGLEPGSTIGVLCRNHRQPLVTAFAASRAGLNVVWLNTSFSRPQAEEVARREGVDLLVHDAELTELVSGITPQHGRIRAPLTIPTATSSMRSSPLASRTCRRRRIGQDASCCSPAGRQGRPRARLVPNRVASSCRPRSSSECRCGPAKRR